MKKVKISKNILLMLSLLIATIIMGIGYASIESITGEIEGKAIADAQSGVFITDVEYVSDVDANIANCEINNFLGTMLNTTIELSKTNPNSKIKYKVKVYNNSSEMVPFEGVIYDDEFYDNAEITFEITEEGFQIGEMIEPNETKEVFIIFKYKNAEAGEVSENNVLRSYLNLKMTEPNRMVLASSATGNYLTSSVTREKIESIKFEQGKEPEYSEEIIARFDASEKQDESIIGYYTDTDSNGLYELTFVSQEIIYANKTAQYLFRNLSNLKAITFDNFGTTGMSNMSNMFNGCSQLKKLDLKKFDTTQVENMTAVFYNCSELTDLDISKINTSNVITMLGMFYSCKGLIELDLRNFNTNKVTNMLNMFSECSELTELNINNFDTSNVTNMLNMFGGCKKLKELDLSNFNTCNVINMGSMFQNCIELVKLDISNFDTSKVTDIQGIFYNCRALEKLDVSRWNVSNVRSMQSIFNGCSNLIELDVSKWDTINVINMVHTFLDCGGLSQIDVSKWNTSKVTSMQNMFSGCSKLTELNVSSFNTSNVVNMQNMFRRCSKLIKLDVSSFDVSNVTTMANMFAECKELTELDLIKFNTIRVSNMQEMFAGNQKLKKIYISKYNEQDQTGWTISNVTSSNNMFIGCNNIVGANDTIYNLNYTDATYARIDTEEEPGYFTNIKDKIVETIQ